MPLTPGTRLGVYEVAEKIGAGGMGEVYRARDTKLDRDVALKVLPDLFANDPERLGRFQREAKALASLNHPNIGSIYGIEDDEADGVIALVLELIEGPTLADRIAQGPIPLDEALPIARQIAEALEAAHERGIIHRDLKPANVKVKSDGSVKVLDFGLAKAFQPDASDPGVSASPTLSLTAAATQMGMVIGTAAYMSPEQAKGVAVDKRADVWAFGCVLYEMLTGRRVFDARDVSEVLASVLLKDPDLTSLPTDVPPSVRSLLGRCLVKESKDRLRDVGEARVALRDAGTAPSASVAPAAPAPRPDPTVAVASELRIWQRPVPAIIFVLLAAVITGLAVGYTLQPESPRIVRFAISPDDAAAIHIATDSPDVAISPTGEHIAYLTGTVGFGGERLHVRPLDQLASETLVAAGELNSPFFSPDGTSVGFYDRRGGSGQVLQRVSVLGGPLSTICELPGNLRGASWGIDGRIVFATPTS